MITPVLFWNKINEEWGNIKVGHSIIIILKRRYRTGRYHLHYCFHSFKSYLSGLTGFDSVVNTHSASVLEHVFGNLMVGAG